MIDIHKIIVRTMRIVPKAYDVSGENFNCDCHLEMTDNTYRLVGNRFNKTQEEGELIVDNYLAITGGNI